MKINWNSRGWSYLVLFLGMLLVPFLLGVATVRLFNQAPEFALSGIFLGELAIHCIFAFRVLKRQAWKNMGLGFILFIVTLTLSFLLSSIDGVNKLVHHLLPGDSYDMRFMRVIALRSLIVLPIWELTYVLIDRSGQVS